MLSISSTGENKTRPCFHGCHSHDRDQIIHKYTHNNASDSEINNIMGVDRELWARSQGIFRRRCLSQDLSDEGEEANTNIQELARQREQKS